MSEKRLDEHLRTSVRLHPDHIAYHFDGRDVSYQELGEQVEHAAGYLSAQGAVKGQGLAILLPNSDAFVILYEAALRLGMYVVPMNPLYTPEELQYMLMDSAVQWIAGARPLMQFAPLLQAKVPGINLIAVGDGEEPLAAGVVDYRDIMSSTWPEAKLPGAVSEDDTAVILYTSGTTGKPKGAMLTHRNLCTNAEIIGDYLNYSGTDRVLAVLPMFHVFCLSVCLHASIYRGAQVVILPRFSPSEVLRVIEEKRITIFLGVPTMYNFLLRTAGEQKVDTRSLRLCISGGAAMPVALMEAFEKHFAVRILEGYGLSEASPVTAFAPVDGRERKSGSIGVTLPGLEQRVVDDQDEELPVGEVGELVVRGPSVMKGYWRRPEETAATLRGGWLHTGDLARMDEDGYFYIVDRKKDMIIVGGFNVYPREIEELLYAHPGIAEAAVIGMPDEAYGEQVVACVVVRDANLTEESVKAYCEAHLVKYKRPAQVRFFEELPKNQTGKVLHRALRERIQAV